MIPATDPMSGYLPVGRYTCTLEEVQRVFVEDSQFAGSVTRRKLFAGLVRYMAEWERLEDMVGTSDVLRRIWVGGSFTSAKLDPDDVDVSPILDGPKLDAIKGKPGCGKIGKLFGNREPGTGNREPGTGNREPGVGCTGFRGRAVPGHLVARHDDACARDIDSRT
ncbi:DUF6932 family protein [Rhodococcus sp. B50]|uniref:DUF6932 family protein n=1 Tax=Rhodococcus sp. B50 TaxID=2682847 RepID=UPI001BD3BB18|nr:hypothetical protein [Rhodococcus sp. B50]